MHFFCVSMSVGVLFHMTKSFSFYHFAHQLTASVASRIIFSIVEKSVFIAHWFFPYFFFNSCKIVKDSCVLELFFLLQNRQTILCFGIIFFIAKLSKNTEFWSCFFYYKIVKKYCVLELFFLLQTRQTILCFGIVFFIFTFFFQLLLNCQKFLLNVVVVFVCIFTLFIKNWQFV